MEKALRILFFSQFYCILFYIISIMGDGSLYALMKQKTKHSPWRELQMAMKYFKTCHFFLLRQETSRRLELPLCKHSFLRLQLCT